MRFINIESQVEVVSDAHSKASNTAYVMLPQAENMDVYGNKTDGKKPT